MPRVLITGSDGQLAYELKRSAPENIKFEALGSKALDITNCQQVNQCLIDVKPQLVINAAAYTAVDKAEVERCKAEAVNSFGVGYLAKACSEINARFIHVSTDFVFDGQSLSPYKSSDTTSPLCVYGETKLMGENLALQYNPNNTAIIRTAWVYSSHARNFVKTMLRLMAEKKELSVVVDQIGTPTWADGLARLCWDLGVKSTANGIFHYTDDGYCSWFDFACEIQRQAVDIGLLNHAIPIYAITTEQYPTPAKRPAYSVLDKTRVTDELGFDLFPWQDQLSKMLNELSLHSV